MKTEKIMTVREERIPGILSALIAVIISTLLGTGTVMMFSTAFQFSYKLGPALLLAALFSLIFTFLHFLWKKKFSTAVLIAVPVVVTLMTIFNLNGIRDGLMEFIYVMQFYALFWLPGEFIEPVSNSEELFAFLESYNLIAINIVTYLLLKRKKAPFALLVYLPFFLSAVANTTMVPASAPCIITATGILLLLLTHAYRHKKIETAERLVLLMILPTVLFTVLLGLKFPQKGYNKQEYARRILTSVQSLAEDPDNPFHRLLDRALNGLRNPNNVVDGSALNALYSSVTDLEHVGPFNPSQDRVMIVTKKYNTHYSGEANRYTGSYLYLKVESLDTYKDNMLSSSNIKTPVYNDDVAPVISSAQYKISITPIVDTSVDIVPFYTDFYNMDEVDYKTDNPYNITTHGDFVFASSAVPVKNRSDIYNERYLEEYVYGTCLSVPKETERALISGGKLPDWYLDVYHGYVQMSDADKVRKVTEFVRWLHPYNDDTAYPPKGVDFVPWFVNDGKSGICIHYAATTAILLRLIGVPARYVRGYVDARSYSSSESIIYSSQAHAWFEFFVPEYGWVMGDSTPGYEEDASHFNIDAISKEHPEIENESFARGKEVSTEPTVNLWELEPGESYVYDLTPTPTPTPTTAPVQPSGGTNTPSRSDKQVEKMKEEFLAVLKVASLILLAVVILLIITGIFRIVYVSYWRRRFTSDSMNVKAVTYYHYFKFIGRILRIGMPGKATEIAEKATFGSGEISSAELDNLLDECRKNTAYAAEETSKFRKILYKLLAVKI